MLAAILALTLVALPAELLGMLMKHDVTRCNGRTILTLSADNLPCDSIRFEIEERHGSLYFADVRTSN